MAEPLARLRRAVTLKRRAEERYRAALRDARDAGCSYGAIAKALGVSRQAVRQLFERGL